MDSGVRMQALERVRVMAAHQHQVAALRDLLDAGVTRAQVEGLVASGWLQRQHKGVYFVGPGEPSPWQRAVAAWTAVGPRAVISHSTAAGLHRMPHLLAGSVPELTGTGPGHPRHRGVDVHRVKELARADIVKRDGVPMTTPARTLVDLAPRLPVVLLRKVIDEGAIQRLWTPESLLITRQRVGRRPGLHAMDQLLGERSGSSLVDSHLEYRVERAVRCLGPFEAQHQVVLGGKVVVIDHALPALKLAVESDGWTVRGRSRGKFDGDRRKNNLLVAHGWTVVHLTSAMSDDEMRRTVVDAMLRLAGKRGPGADQT
ncbi:MAG TPA: hypothetical protein VFH70_12430 [Acidimicrobiales bacterium]|nr:hypothetical protein [Acidimicrobiales bacterium]